MSNAPTILVVDDDRAMREMLVSLLEDQGIKVRCAGSADDALEAAKGTRFDAVVSDVRLRGKDGFRLTVELGELQPSTPVILMTAFGDSTTGTQAKAVGAFDHLAKPFRLCQLMAVLERVFGG